MSAAHVRALRALAEPIVARHDCDLEDVVIRPVGRRRLVRIVVDHDGGLTLDLVAAISRDISLALDEADVLGDSAFVLEVTSPGVDRPLGTARQWRRAAGRLVAVTPLAGEPFVGRVVSANAQSAKLEVGGRQIIVRLEDVARAVVQVEFTRIDDVDLGAEDLDSSGEDVDVAEA
ncbi:MAG: ribosome maturation factor RimP [Candidatus Nanopelagicales bacterium]